jgi:hypothetical protein
MTVETEHSGHSVRIRICPHTPEHDKIRITDGYVRDGLDDHRSVCVQCFRTHPDRRKKRFHSPHHCYTIMIFLDITNLGKLAFKRGKKNEFQYVTKLTRVAIGGSVLHYKYKLV